MSSSSSDQEETLLEACSSGNVARFEEIIQNWKQNNCPIIIDIRDNHNFGAIHHAVRSCSIEMINAVLKYKEVFDLNNRTFEGWTPLMLCCYYPRQVPIEIFRALLEASDDVIQYMSIRNNEEVSVLHKAVEIERIDFVKELLKFNADPNVMDLDRETPLHYAVRSGNMEIIQLLIETGKTNAKVLNYVEFDALSLVFGMEFENTKKLEIVQYLLPHTYLEDPTRPGYYSVFEILKPLILSSRRGNNILSEYFISNFYCEKYNSKYGLIQKLQAASSHSHIVCAFLHDEICRYDQYYCQIFRHLNIEASIIGVVLELIMRETSESMDLAVETARALLDIHFDSLLKEEFLYQHPPDFEIFLSNFRDVPNPKLLFHFYYHLLDTETEPKLFDLIFCCFTICNPNDTPHIFRTTFQILIPFIIRDYHSAALLQECNNHDALEEFHTFLPYSIVSRFQQSSNQAKGISLKRLCRDAIRTKVAEVVTNPKEFIDRILGLIFPETLKCYLLHICDINWIKDLKSHN